MESAESFSDGSESRLPHHMIGLGWLMALVAAWLVFELTANDSLSAVAMCSKLGWDDWLTAIWLLRKDPRKIRAAVCALVFIASGLLKTTVSSLVAMLGLLAIHAGQGPPAQPPAAFGAVALSLFISFAGSSLLTFVALWLASKTDTKAWVEWRIHQARRNDAWPPTAYCQVNRLDYLTVASLIGVGTPAMLAAVLGLAALVTSWANGDPAVESISVTVLMLVGMPVLFLSIFVVGGIIGSHATALSPEACWGSKPLPADALLNRFELHVCPFQFRLAIVAGQRASISLAAGEQGQISTVVMDHEGNELAVDGLLESIDAEIRKNRLFETQPRAFDEAFTEVLTRTDSLHLKAEYSGKCRWVATYPLDETPLNVRVLGDECQLLALQTLETNKLTLGSSEAPVFADSSEKGPAPVGHAAVAKVKVMDTGRIYLNGRSTDLTDLRRAFLRLKEQRGEVWYRRETSTGEPPEEAMAVIKAVSEARLPIKICEADFE